MRYLTVLSALEFYPLNEVAKFIAPGRDVTEQKAGTKESVALTTYSSEPSGEQTSVKIHFGLEERGHKSCRFV